MTAKLFLTGIRAEGRHGVHPWEKETPQPFVVDLDLELDVAGDELGGTADYRAIVRAVQETVETASFDLLESLAAAVASAVVSLERVLRATVVVHKPEAARSVGVDGIAAAASAGGD